MRPLKQADAESEVCDDPTCKKYFNYFVRRHHCRRCGNIFCDSHSPEQAPLDESANYNPRASLARVCNHCFGEFQSWACTRKSIAPAPVGGSRAALQHRGSSTVPASPMTASSPMSSASPTTPGKTQPEVAISVPSDWNWSTF